jgi:hypothetical protein
MAVIIQADLGTNQPPIQWVPGAHFHLVPRLGMHTAMPLLPLTSAWGGA